MEDQRSIEDEATGVNSRDAVIADKAGVSGWMAEGGGEGELERLGPQGGGGGGGDTRDTEASHGRQEAWGRYRSTRLAPALNAHTSSFWNPSSAITRPPQTPPHQGPPPSSGLAGKNAPAVKSQQSSERRGRRQRNDWPRASCCFFASSERYCAAG